MKNLLSLFAILALLFSAATSAEEEKKKDEKKDEEKEVKVDNASLKASLGSQSLWSFNSSLGYSGASLRKPFGIERPDPNGDGGELSTAFSGSLGGRYRLNKTQSITFGASFVLFVDPMMESTKKLSFSRPSVEFNDLRRFGKVIYSQYVYIAKYTDQDTLDMGYFGDFGYGATVLRKVEGTNFTLGLSFSGYIEVFKDGLDDPYTGDRPGKKTIREVSRQDYGFNVSPYIEYKINDTFNLKTKLSQSYMHYRTNEKKWHKFHARELYQSIGLGASINDVTYLYSYVSFYPAKNFLYPDNLKENSFNSTSSYGISLSFSLF